MTGRSGLLALAALGLAAVILIAVELARGGASYGSVATEHPCAQRAAFQGGGLDATVQRIVLDGLDGAACRLGTTREQLVLSFSGTGPTRWSRKTIERAVRAGLLHAVDQAQARGDVGSLTAGLLRQVIERAPLQLLINGGAALGGLFG